MMYKQKQRQGFVEGLIKGNAKNNVGIEVSLNRSLQCQDIDVP